MNELMLRRRAMMGMQKAEEPNGLQPSASVGLGATVASVSDDGFLHIDFLKTGWANRIICYFKRPFSVVAGDSVNIKIVRKSGSGAGFYSNVYLNGDEGLTNAIWANKEVPLNKTITMSASRTVTFIAISDRNVDQTPTNYSVEVQITVNGTRIL